MKSEESVKSGHKKFADLKNSRRDFLIQSGKITVAGITSLAFQSCSNLSQNTDKTSTPVNLTSNNILTNDDFWARVRSQFVLDPDIIHMNTSTEGAMPQPVLSGLNKNSCKFAENPVYSAIKQEDYEIKQRKNCRKVAEFLCTDPKDVVLTTNTTEGMHIALNGLDFDKGDEIITTLHEHGSVSSPLHVLRDRKGIKINELALPSPPKNGQQIIDIFDQAITKKTRALCFCHINYTSGLQLPVKELCELARSKNIISIVDGAHAVGMLNFKLSELGADFYACSGHKWLNGPPGTGIFYIRNAKDNPHGLWPILTEVYSVRKSFPITKLLQMRGQQNTPALSAMIEALDFQETIGKDKIQKRILSLNRYLKEKIVECWGDRSLITPEGDDNLCSGIASFVPFNKFEDRYIRSNFSNICKTLENHHKIHIRNIWFKDQKSHKRCTFALRISTHLFNRYDEIDRVLSAIKSIV